MTALRLSAAYCAALAVAVFAVGVVHAQLALADLAAVGLNVDLPHRLSATFVTVRGFVPTLGPVLALGFLIAFTVAAGARRVLKPLAPVGYTLAAAAAMLTAVLLMNLQYGTTPIAAARTPLGLAALCAAAAIGGLAFDILLTLGRPGMRTRFTLLARRRGTAGS